MPEEQNINQEPPTPQDPPLGEGGRSALEKEKEARKQLERELAAAREKLSAISSIDVDEYQKLKDAQKAAEEEKMRREQEFQKLAEQRQQQLQERELKIKEYENKVKELEQTNKLQSIYFKHGGKQEISQVTGQTSFEQLTPVFQSRLRRYEDGTYYVVGLDGIEQRREDGKIKGIDDLFEELKLDKNYGHLFVANVPSGNGISNGRPGQPPQLSADDWVKQVLSKK